MQCIKALFEDYQKLTGREVCVTEWQMLSLTKRLAASNTADNAVVLDVVMSFAIEEGLLDIVKYLFLDRGIVLPLQTGKSSLMTKGQDATMHFIEYVKRYSRMARKDGVFVYTFNNKYRQMVN